MGAFDKAAEIFRTALHFIDENTPEGQAKHVSTHILLARAYLEAGRSFEAIQILHPLVRNDEISIENKVEFFYLMGIAHDLRKERKIALAWFNKVRDIDPHFRDIRERLRKPLGKTSK
jgi:tetratricopeptide (TPR) repeat protein